jgi:spore maturation protein CgeB
MLAEDTEEHRALFGPDGECVLYFASIEQMRERLDWLLSHDAERARLAAAARERLLAEDHSYAHRLQQMLAFALEAPTGAARR